MRYTGTVLDRIRKRTKNTDWSTGTDGQATSGITNELILEYINDGQDLLQSRITAIWPDFFLAEKEISVVANQADYTINDRVFMGTQLIAVFYSNTGNARDYYPLDPISIRERRTNTASCPSGYVRRNSQITLSPIPSSSTGKIRVQYYRSLDDLDIRRAQIEDFPTATTILVIPEAGEVDYNFTRADYLCINDKYGTVTDYNIENLGYNTGTLTFTIPSGLTIVGQIEDWITFGQYTTTHSKLMDDAERFIKLYAQKRIMDTDENTDSVLEDSEVKSALNDILQSLAITGQDIQTIPIVDEGIMW